MKQLFAFAAILLSFLTASSQSVTGNWEGALSANGAELTVIFHLAKDSTGKLTGTMDSPKQMAYGLKCSSVIVHADSLIIEMKGFGAKYEGVVKAENKLITGNWSQGGMSLPLDMKKTSDVATVNELKRPQTPKPPYRYTSEDVVYQNTDKSITFGATFTIPRNTVLKKSPAVILITGSGKQDRDETIFQHKPFAVIADYLTSHGIAVLRVDDRDKGKTTGDFKTATTVDFAKDVEAGIEYLKTRPEVDVANIGLIGHSEGGMIAPMVASRRKDIKFIVLLAGPGEPIIDLMEQQMAAVMLTRGVPKNDVDQYKPVYKTTMLAAINEKDSAAAAKKIVDLLINWQSKTDSATVKNTTGIIDEESSKEFAAAIITQLQNPWFRYFINYKPADYLSRVKCAVLALNGEKDIQVAAAPNIEAIRAIMVGNKVRTFKTEILPGLNHLFQHCKICDVAEYATLEETFSPQALQLIGDWITQATK